MENRLLSFRGSLFLPNSCTSVREASEVGHARRMAIERARALDFSETEIGTVGVVVTEAANNLVKHAHQGILLFRTLIGKRGSGLEILSIDHGPGIQDVERSLQDGYSTAGSPGTGMGAIARSASLFEIFSQPGSGTVMVMQVWTKEYRASRRDSRLEVGAVSVPVAHETVSGDAWALSETSFNPRLLMVDGLGHGSAAALAAAEATKSLQLDGARTPLDFVNRAHLAMAPTRGAALAVVDFDLERRQLTFVGVGNISGRVWDSTMERNFVSSHGIVGHEIHTPREYQYPWPQDASVVMATDGLLTRWSLDKYPGLRLRHPSLLAGVLFRDFERGNDDVTVVAVRERS